MGRNTHTHTSLEKKPYGSKCLLKKIRWGPDKLYPFRAILAADPRIHRERCVVWYLVCGCLELHRDSCLIVFCWMLKRYTPWKNINMDLIKVTQLKRNIIFQSYFWGSMLNMLICRGVMFSVFWGKWWDLYDSTSMCFDTWVTTKWLNLIGHQCFRECFQDGWYKTTLHSMGLVYLPTFSPLHPSNSCV